MKFQAPRGTHDILPDQAPSWYYVEGIVRTLCQLYGYRQIVTPIFEETGLFLRGVGTGTDIVEKEMYTFADKGGDSLTLRPEGTAPILRAYLEHGMQVLPQPVKLYYIAPIFRYDRPQKGRYRQHHQFGVEAIGETDPALDAEVIALADTLYRRLGLSGITLQLNSVGCPDCRPLYRSALIDYYRPHERVLCPDCVQRLKVNPLRLLDCKVERCQVVAEGAPKALDYLCDGCCVHFTILRRHLDNLGIPYLLNNRLVRGLNYYTKTVFEFWRQGLGAQNAIGGGGRYDGLAEELGGRPAPGVGFGLGLERIIMSLQEQGVEVPDLPSPEVFIAHIGERAGQTGFRAMNDLREKGIGVVYAFGDRSLKAQMRSAGVSGARWTLIFADDDLERGVVVCRDMQRGAQQEVPLERVVRFLQEKVRGLEVPGREQTC
jgi:histidyl-tRNA synthetase